MIPRMSSVRDAIAAATLVLLLVTAGAGCSATIVPPAKVSDPVDVFVADYGRHSSLLLPTPVDQVMNYTEYAFGDWRWFAEGDTQWTVAVTAMVHSRQATLGRRQVTRPDANAPDDEIRFARAVECDKLIRIRCSRESVTKLSRELDERFVRAAQPPGIVIHSDYSELDHVKDGEGYWALHNCNHVTAEWLRQLGCDVRGAPMLSHYKLSPQKNGSSNMQPEAANVASSVRP
jgi:hypothetical protein